MSTAVIRCLSSALGGRILESSGFRGDDEASVAPVDWVAAARFLRDEPETQMDHFVDLTAIDWPERAPEEGRFDVLLSLRSSHTKARVRLRTRVAEGASLPTLVSVFEGANWAEREVWDMFGIHFEGHPDLRRILLYEEFEGHPLRKDYPIHRTQPLVSYRDVADITKVAPYGVEEGQPFARIDWAERLEGADRQVSPAIALSQGQRRSLSDSEAARTLSERIAGGDDGSPPPAASEE